MTDDFIHKTVIDIKAAESLLWMKMCYAWKNEIDTKPKLRTSILFKESFETEDYVKFNKNRLCISLIVQIRSGTLPLNIETGRFRQIAVEDRLCVLRNLENEFHFICQWALYDEFSFEMYEM